MPHAIVMRESINTEYKRFVFIQEKTFSKEAQMKVGIPGNVGKEQTEEDKECHNLKYVMKGWDYS